MPSLPVLAKQVAGALFGGLTENSPFSRKLAIVGAFSASGVRFAAGTMVRGASARAEKPLRLWEFERCPHSRAVRESLSELDVDFEVRPCPVGGARFRTQVSGVPQLEDPNAGVMLSGRATILEHLHRKYGDGSTRWFLGSAPVVVLSSVSMRLLHANRGGNARPSRAPENQLELWGFESSPYCHFARAALSELELPYLQHNLAKDSPQRDAFVAQFGKMQVPYLHDPNTGTGLFESAKIVDYLRATYSA